MKTQKNNWKFFQVSKEISQIKTLSAEAKLLLAYLIFRQGKNATSHWPIVVMAEDLGMSENRIDQALRELKVYNLIAVGKMRVKSSFCNVYSVNFDLISTVRCTPLKPDPSKVRLRRFNGAKRDFQRCDGYQNKEKEKKSKSNAKEIAKPSSIGKTNPIDSYAMGGSNPPIPSSRQDNTKPFRMILKEEASACVRAGFNRRDVFHAVRGYIKKNPGYTFDGFRQYMKMIRDVAR